MDPRDHPSDLVGDADCAACGRPVPRERVRFLARREDLAFAELPCEPCGSVSLAIFLGGSDTIARRELAPGPRPPAGADDDAGTRSRLAPVAADDVLDMHLFLAGWTGDLRSLVRPRDRTDGPAGAA